MRRSRPRSKPNAIEVSERDEVRRMALSLLARREHSSRELHFKLTARGCAESDVVAVLATLRGERLLSDDRFAEAYVASRRERGYGPLRIEAELRERGIGDETIAAYLDESERDWLDRARAVREKRFGTALPGSAAEQAKQIRFLNYRGFGSEHIRKALRGDAEC